MLRALLVSVLFALCGVASAAELGEVSTAFKFLGPDHKIVVEVFDDPKVSGVSCFISRAKTGGVMGGLGLAEDKSDASVACRQIGDAIGFPAGAIPKQEEVFTERASALFKKVRVVRMVDPARNTLVYLVYSDKLIDGSPKNSITAVPVPKSVPIPVR